MILMLNGLIGIAVTSGTTYTGSFFYRFPASSSFRGSATVSLQSSSGATLGSTTVSLSGAQTSWLQVNFSIRAGSTPGDLNNHFVITLDGGSAAGQRINFGLLSLFPPTFKNRQNGMRNDIASALAEMGPSFWRFPGGNNLEGGTVDQRWQWNATVNNEIGTSLVQYTVAIKTTSCWQQMLCSALGYHSTRPASTAKWSMGKPAENEDSTEYTFSGTAYPTNSTARQVRALPPINVDFQVQVVSVSGLIVWFLKDTNY